MWPRFVRRLPISSAREVGEVVELARDPVRIFAIEQELYRVRLGAGVLLVEQAREPRALRIEVAPGAAILFGEIRHPRVDRALVVGQLAQEPIGLGNRALRLAQCVDGFVFGFLGFGELLLQ